jgi:lysyl-tRNA synthetase class 2
VSTGGDSTRGGGTPGGGSGGEAELIRVRREKAAAIRARGDDPFANDVPNPARSEGSPAAPRLDIAAVREAHAPALREGTADRYDREQVSSLRGLVGRVRVTGRVIFSRSFGGGAFVRLRDRTGELQLYCQSQAEERDPTITVLGDGIERLTDLDLGDIVEAEGLVMATDKGELSLSPDRVRVLTKALRPLPTKTSFKDVEARYRMRYVDLVANKEVASVFRARSVILGAIRAFLDGRGYLEVETPTMHTVIGGAAAKPFVTHHNVLDMDLFMRIAPELFLKRLLVGGFDRVYEIARCYRNEGLSTRHNPEFTMLEFYEAYATYDTLMDCTEELLRHVDASLARVMPTEHAQWASGREFTFERFARVPMRQCVEAALALADLPAEAATHVAHDDAPIKAWAKAAKAKKREIDWTNYRTAAKKAEGPGELLFCAYEYLAEPFLAADYRHEGKSVPVFVTDHPFEISPLARKKDVDPSLVDRFELFVDGRELCNAFSELNDPDDQAERFRAQVDKKARGAEETMDFDADYVRALEYGMPPAAGFGMGVDRLTMLLTGAKSIRDVILFPLLRPEAI